MSNETKLAGHLQEALDLIEGKCPLEECLERYPQQEAADLRPLLAQAAAVRSALAARLSPSAQERIQARMRARIAQEREARADRWWLRWLRPPSVPRWAVSAAAVVLVVCLAGTGTLTTSANALPGDALYSVKMAREDASLWLAGSPEARIAAYSALVRERATELRDLALAGRSQDNGVPVARLQQHLDGLANELSAIQAQSAGVDGGGRALREAAVDQQNAAAELRSVLDGASPEAHAQLETALTLLERARSRVLEAADDLQQPVTSHQ